MMLCVTVLPLPALGQAGGGEGKALPRFVSLKSDPANLRTGPGRKYPKAWVFRRSGLPVEIVQEQGHWRRVRDSEGAEGWILSALLSRRRTALVLPWETRKANGQRFVDLKSSPRNGAATVARLEAGALANVKTCNGRWCRITAGDYSGFVSQKVLWGVYPDEVIN